MVFRYIIRMSSLEYWRSISKARNASRTFRLMVRSFISSSSRVLRTYCWVMVEPPCVILWFFR